MSVESILDAPRAAPLARHLNPLTGVRIVAAAAIVEGHSWEYWGTDGAFLLGMSLQHGVSMFFVLSGFILAYSYPTIEDVRARHFVLARFARVWPMHIFATLLLFLLVPSALGELRQPGEFFTILHYVTLTHAWYPTWQNFLAFNGVAWSISVEAAFYLTFPLWIANWGKLNWLKLPLACAPLVVMIQYANGGNLSLTPKAPGITMQGLLHFSPLSRLPEFVLGVLVGEFWTRRRFDWSPVLSTIAEIIVVVALWIAVRYAWFIAYDPRTVQFLGSAGSFWLEQNGFTPVFAAFIFVLASSTGLAARFLGWRPIVILGEVSFSVYLLHSILLRYYQSFPGLIAHHPGAWLLLYWLGIISMSYLAFEFVETPCRALITRKHARSSISNTRLRMVVLAVAIAVTTAAILFPLL
ncbi:acyltransferase [Rhizobium leguminosarum]|uniref:acyltransferase family protein n=1 Tax=Rhizobium leguminosarum TaxID=384 RepID=UPI00103158BD|nr:acyltransferase [Rhizobium leguminosarum]TBC92956.1 acyltransferase [Rhizobium leguminosarum]